MPAARNAQRSTRDNNGRILSIAEILEAKDLKEDTVEVPEWGGSVKIRELTQGEQEKILAKMSEGDGPPIHRQERWTVHFGMIDPAIPEDQVDALAEKAAGAVERVAQAIDALAADTPENRKKSRASFRAGAGG